MIRGDDDQCLGVLLGILSSDSDALIEGELIMDDRPDVIAMPTMIDPSTFHLQQESVAILLQSGQCTAHHLGQCGYLLGDFRLLVAVDAVRQVARPEEAQQPLCPLLPHIQQLVPRLQ